MTSFGVKVTDAMYQRMQDRVASSAYFAGLGQLVSLPLMAAIIAGIAIGYSDAGHFTRAFLRWTGLTPREFRRLRRETAGDVTGSPGDQTPTAG